MLPMLRVPFWLALFLAMSSFCAAFSRPNFQLEAAKLASAAERHDVAPNDMPAAWAEQQWPEWKRSHRRICSLFRGLCPDSTATAFKVTAMATFDMLENMLGIGSGWFVLVVLPCAACGLFLLPRRDEAPQERVGPCRQRKASCIDWWSCGPQITPASLKVFLTVLLLIELLGLQAPQSDVFTLPEMIRRVRAHPYGRTPELGLRWGFACGDDGDAGLMPRLTYVFMPNLNDATADSYAWVFSILRTSLLVSWCTFLVLPCAWAPSWACFVWGVVVYVVMASVGTMYQPYCVSVCTCFFLVAAACILPSLKKSPRARAWLGMFLIVSTLAPFYGKGRWGPVLSGSWLTQVLQSASDRSAVPGFVAWIVKTPVVAAVMSFGVLLVEFLLPLAVLFLASSSSDLACWLRTCWILLATFFHITTIVIVGPNFARQLPLLMMLLHGVWHPIRSTDAEAIEPEQMSSWARRVSFATALLVLWMCNELWSDFDHIFGATPRASHHDMQWPLPEMSMFTWTSTSTNYVRSLCLEIAIAVALSSKVFSEIIWPASAVKGEQADSLSLQQLDTGGTSNRVLKLCLSCFLA
ncbi:VWA3A [Symbiodinium sp. CCMP2592]|nr:VWA3A [Symbiodinium sp. CCMP2592]